MSPRDDVMGMDICVRGKRELEKTPNTHALSAASHLECPHLKRSPHCGPDGEEVAIWRGFLKHLRDQPRGTRCS